jgi:hypothetical protein
MFEAYPTINGVGIIPVDPNMVFMMDCINVIIFGIGLFLCLISVKLLLFPKPKDPLDYEDIDE